MAGPKTVTLDGEGLTPEAVEQIAGGAGCKLAGRARQRVRRSRRTVERATAGGARVYGVNTGFGHLAQVSIADDKLDELQRNLVRSHAAGVGNPLPEPEVRAIMALRANCLARGHSGLREQTLDLLIGLLNAGVHPVVPAQGSVGASGDLAPLAHIALGLMGEGQATVDGRRMRCATALKRAGLAPARLEAKEGLALVNGTQMMTGIGVLTLVRAERLCTIADIAGAMSLEALKGSHRAFDRRIHAARPHPGQRASAANLRGLLRDSAVERSHVGCGRVQDAYSLRCMPQVHGAVRDALTAVRKVLVVEINASTDNPMVFEQQNELISGGNFHGQPVSMALDQLGIATCSLGTISERRIERLLNPDLSDHPAFLATDPGLHSGFMLAHVTAAALVSENKVLAHPASVDSVPTSAGKEDHVSMGAHAARKARSIVEHVSSVLAIELLAAAQALDLLRPLRAGRAVEAVRRAIRRRITHMDRDRVLADDIAAMQALIDDQTLLRAARRAFAKLT